MTDRQIELYTRCSLDRKGYLPKKQLSNLNMLYPIYIILSSSVTLYKVVGFFLSVAKDLANRCINLILLYIEAFYRSSFLLF